MEAGSSRAKELFTANGYETVEFCALNDWKAKGYELGETATPGAGRIQP